MFFLFTCLLFLVMIITNIVFIRRCDRLFSLVLYLGKPSDPAHEEE